MARKIALTGILILLVAAGSVFAHDQGDLVLNIEPQIGVAFPFLQAALDGMMPGVDFGLRGTVNYYFTDNFSVNVGLGYAGNYNLYLADEKEGGYDALFPVNGNWLVAWFFLWPIMLPVEYANQLIQSAVNQLIAEHTDYFFASYITIPFGVCYEVNSSFDIGAGLIGNIPLYGSSRMQTKDIGSIAGETITFTLKPYLGWYVDFGFPSNEWFTMAFRLNGAFSNETAEPSSQSYKSNYDPYIFNFFSMSLVLRFGIPLASFSL